MRSLLFLIPMLASTLMATELPEKNRLAAEKSPYLLQHATNPVDWYPWGEEAFTKAKKENKPILLSIGYSTCHWCHVMERESFENEKIAAYLNEHFVAIKLDREERPDIDQIYMTAFQAMNGGAGGWPLNMFLTPALHPFTGGTYFPPESREGRLGFLEVLQRIHEAWAEKPEDIKKQAAAGVAQIQAQLALAPDPAENAPNLELVSAALAAGSASVDSEWGGIGNAPKFPQVTLLRFLLNHGDPELRGKILMTCRRMMEGGIHDHLGGGFHRYAVDREWLVPHFEKMLYDQAQLLELYLDAYLWTGEPDFKTTAEGIISYLRIEMTGAGGAFYAAQDAQSEDKEGKYWTWTLAELKSLLTPEELAATQSLLGATAKGNFLDHSDPEPLPDLNILHFNKPHADLTEAEKTTLASVFQKLRAVRIKRVPPATDDKILASWNGLAIAALARAARVLEDETILADAEKAHFFVKENLFIDGTLHHRWREGERDTIPQAESYLFFLHGTLRLYETTLNPDYLAFAIQLAEGALEKFHDPAGGFYQGVENENLVMRLKGQYDGATPSESSIGAQDFARLAEITGRKDFAEIASGTLAAFRSAMENSPLGLAGMTDALAFHLGENPRVALTPGTGRETLLRTVFQTPGKFPVTLGTTGPVEELAQTLTPTDGKATAFLCTGQTCRPPVTDPAKLKSLLTPER